MVLRMKYSILVHDLSKIFLNFDDEKTRVLIYVRVDTRKHKPMWKIHVKVKHFL
jgi:hypothetical protein